MITGEVMDSVASLQNDTAKKTYTYTAQLPYLSMAMDELQEEMARSNVNCTNETSLVITLPAGTTVLGFKTTPKLPANLIDIQRVWESQTGMDQYIPVGKVNSLPLYLEGTETSYFICYAWNGQEIRLLPSNQINDLKIDYIRSVFPRILDVDGLDEIDIIGTKSYLQYKTAALCSQFIGENPSRAEELNQLAVLALDRALGISAKGNQNITTRRRPFRSSYKNRGIW